MTTTVAKLVNQGCFDSILEGQVNTNFANLKATADAAVPAGSATQLSGLNLKPTLLSGATDAIPPHTAASYVITTAGVDACTLAAPTAGTDDGKMIYVYSSTANAHTITATGLFQDGGTTTNVATFAAHAGAGLILMAYNAKWITVALNAVTMS